MSKLMRFLLSLCVFASGGAFSFHVIGYTQGYLIGIKSMPADILFFACLGLCFSYYAINE